MFNDFVQWVLVSSYAEILGSLIIIAFAVGVLYILYEVIKFFIDMYIQSKLVELYKQKDRLWDGYQDLYDSYEDLKEKTWDYDITKNKLYLLTKDVSALEEYVLGGIELKKDAPSRFEGTWIDYREEDLVLDFFKHKGDLVYLKVVSLPESDNVNLVGSIVTLTEGFLESHYYNNKEK